MESRSDYQAVRFPVGTRVRVVNADGDYPFGRIGGKDSPYLGLGLILTVVVVRVPENGIYADVPPADRPVMYSLAGSAGVIFPGNFMNKDLVEA
jgi:hypothetical protein